MDRVLHLILKLQFACPKAFTTNLKNYFTSASVHMFYVASEWLKYHRLQCVFICLLDWGRAATVIMQYCLWCCRIYISFLNDVLFLFYYIQSLLEDLPVILARAVVCPAYIFLALRFEFKELVFEENAETISDLKPKHALGK